MEPLSIEEFYRNFESKEDCYSFPIAKDNNKYVFSSLKETPSLFIVGAPGSGRVPFHHMFLSTLLSNNSRKTLQVYLIDPVICEFSSYANCPQVVDFATTKEEIQETFQDVLSNVELREKFFNDANVNSIDEYNKKVYEKLPRILLAIDAFRYDEHIKEHINTINILTHLPKDYGINIVISTYNIMPDADLESYKQDFKNIICFRVYDEENSIRAIGQPGAELLYNDSECFYKQNDKITILKIIPFIPSATLKEIINRIKK